MKRTNLLLAGAVMCLSTFTACTNESEEMQTDELREIVATADHFVPEADSRAFSFVNNSVEFAWADGDTIGIFPNTGAQAYFPILAESAGTNTASFTGGGWALKSSSTYAAYYPFIGDFYMSQKEIPVSYEGQKQTGNASMTHLSAFDFMAASGSTPSSGKVNFQFAHLGAFVQLKITMPQGGTLASVTLSADQAVFTTEGTIDLTANTPAIKSVKKSKALTLDVENVTTTAESNVATLYMMLAPVDFTNRTLSAIVKTSNGSTETITLTGKNFEAGKAYGVTGTMKDPNGGVTAGNGTYKDGVVCVDVAGNMKKLLGSDYLNITELKVVGPINGDDIYYLRKMLGGSEFSETDRGKLATLDLSEATIVEGGEWYYSSSYYTSNNVIGNRMFYECANLTSIVLPYNTTLIGVNAFMNCTTLASITIPGSSITSVGYSKFSGSGSFINCPQLKNIYINDLAAWCNIDFHTEDSNPLYFGGDLYLNGELITELVIPENISEIEGLAFYNCGSIEKVIIHNEVLSIGSNSFCGCDALKEAVILSGEIGSYSFYDCEALNNITIGGGVTSIGESAFAYCDALTNVYITDLSAWCKIDFNSHTSNPLIYGGKLYLNDHLVTELVIPNDVTAINPYTFYGCSNITKVTIPDHVTSIGKYAFSNCSALTTVKIGNGVTMITLFTFSNCSALATVEIGNGVTKIGDAAFQYCNIKTFYCYASTPPSLTYNPYSPFKSDIEEEATLYVPARKGSVYKSSNWGDNFTNIVEMD